MEQDKLLFSLSKDKGDFIVQPFKGSGKGGQKRNKTMSCCRITHPASGIVSECQDERSYEQNKKKAFMRLLEKPEFKQWHKIETAKKLGLISDIEEEVRKAFQVPTDFKIEIQVDGKWVKVEESDLIKDDL